MIVAARTEHLAVLRSAIVDSVRQELQDSFGRSHLDHLVNNAGIAVFAPFAMAEQDDFDETFSVNVKAPYFLTKALLETFTDGSRILNISTAVSSRAVVPGLSVYAASKGAVEVLSRRSCRTRSCGLPAP
jgi:NAD(P)-dependent dehydrogenase (short-subunit alcohol dehydrogenase family)